MPEIIKVNLNDLASVLDIPPDSAAELSAIQFRIHELTQAAPQLTEAALPQVRSTIAAIRTSLQSGNIKCDKSPTEPPSDMEPIFNGGKITFVCFHEPAHEFQIDV